MKLELEITCELCGATHRVLLDDDGRYVGPAECDETEIVEYQVAPDFWQRLQTALGPDEVVH